jgi:hypothetical protein
MIAQRNPRRRKADTLPTPPEGTIWVLRKRTMLSDIGVLELHPVEAHVNDEGDAWLPRRRGEKTGQQSWPLASEVLYARTRLRRAGKKCITEYYARQDHEAQVATLRTRIKAAITR